MQELIELVELILATAKQGKTIVVHCRAGLGRSGLVIAACLVALGYSPKEAFTIVRQARPGSVETEEQEAYVYKFAQAWRAA
jgi:protein-tyrosine phosphatase